MKRLIELYKAQVRLLWSWRGGPLALIWRFLVTIIVSAVSFGLTALLLPGITVASVGAAIAAVIVMTVFNGLIRTGLLVLVAPYSLIVTGVLVLVLQVGAFLIVAATVPGVVVNGIGTALVGSFVYAIFDTILTAILGVDRGGTFYAQLIQALLAKQAAPHSDGPGVVIVQIDGLA